MERKASGEGGRRGKKKIIESIETIIQDKGQKGEKKTMKELFKIDSSYHSDGSVFFVAASRELLASAGSNGIVHIFDRHGASG